jgi:hypothetical protein
MVNALPSSKMNFHPAAAKRAWKSVFKATVWRANCRSGASSDRLSFFPGGSPMGLVLLIVLVILLLGGLPTWPHSRNWGYAPSGLLGTLLVIVLVLLLLGYIPGGF